MSPKKSQSERQESKTSESSSCSSTSSFINKIRSLCADPNHLFIVGENYVVNNETLPQSEKSTGITNFPQIQTIPEVTNKTSYMQSELPLISEENGGVKESEVKNFSYEDGGMHKVEHSIYDRFSIESTKVTDYYPGTIEISHEISLSISPQEIADFEPLCQNCNEKYINVELNCSHKYCSDCAVNIICEAYDDNLLLTKSERDKLGYPSCKICKDELINEDYLKIVSPIWDGLLLEPDPSKWKACYKCNNKKETDMFIGDLCKECFALDLRRGKVKIEKQNKKVRGFLKEQGYCNGCKELRYFVKDCLVSVCLINHHYCKNCLDKIKKTGNCLECKTGLQENFYKKISKVLKWISKARLIAAI